MKGSKKKKRVWVDKHTVKDSLQSVKIYIFDDRLPK